jgi:hypothetical protein
MNDPANIARRLLGRLAGSSGARTRAREHADRHVKRGMPQQQVKRKLGPPDAREGNAWTYFLDPVHGWDVEFDSRKRVERVRYFVS